MSDYRQQILEAKTGDIIPIVREIDIDCPVEFFAKLSDYGRAENCLLLESKDHLNYGRGWSLRQHIGLK